MGKARWITIFGPNERRWACRIGWCKGDAERKDGEEDREWSGRNLQVTLWAGAGVEVEAPPTSSMIRVREVQGSPLRHEAMTE